MSVCSSTVSTTCSRKPEKPPGRGLTAHFYRSIIPSPPPPTGRHKEWMFRFRTKSNPPQYGGLVQTRSPIWGSFIITSNGKYLYILSYKTRRDNPTNPTRPVHSQSLRISGCCWWWRVAFVRILRYFKTRACQRSARKNDIQNFPLCTSASLTILKRPVSHIRLSDYFNRHGI